MIPLTIPDLKELIFSSQEQRQGLKKIYSQLPDTSCQHRTLFAVPSFRNCPCLKPWKPWTSSGNFPPPGGES